MTDEPAKITPRDIIRDLLAKYPASEWDVGYHLPDFILDTLDDAGFVVVRRAPLKQALVEASVAAVRMRRQ
jgi:hypothetical protein